MLLINIIFLVTDNWSCQDLNVEIERGQILAKRNSRALEYKTFLGLKDNWTV